MKKTWFAVSALALTLGATSGGLAARAYASPVSSPAAGYQEGQGRWDEAPSEYREVQRQGFHDGVEAARSDFESRRHKDADDHEMYRHPRVERNLRDDYRHAFREGYSRAMHHMKEERHDHDEPHS
jgi:Spy/CpxP family protein refolding chaperone